MKTNILFILVVLLTLSGCASFAKIDAQIPDGNWKNVQAGVTGKFTSTTVKATGVKKDGKWVTGEIHFKHTDPWITDSYLDLEASANIP